MKKDDWAEEKVRVFYPACREKTVLRALAHYADRGGLRVWASYATIARDTGCSVRTVRRHVRTLVQRGDLITWCDVARQRPSNYFYLPICTETVTELEERTGISRKQMRLPFVRPELRAVPVVNDIDRAQVLAELGVHICPSGKVHLAQGQGQNVPVTLHRPTNEHNSSKIFFKKGDTLMTNHKETDTDTQRLEISDATRAMIASTLEALKVKDGYQSNPNLKRKSDEIQASRLLIAAEREAAEKSTHPYVEVGQ